VLGAGNGAAIQPVPEVNYPAASPHAVGVGGTVITTDGTNHGQRVSESSWTFSGGGSSAYIAEPAYQKPVAAVNHECISQPDGTPYVPPTVCRGIPDVADLSGNILGNGYFIYIDGVPSSEGGTSLSSPLMMGQWTRLQAAAPPGGLGFANETFYRQGTGPNYHRDFYDITTSENGVGNGFYSPGPGWDYASGWGALDVAHLLSDVDHTTVARSRAVPAELPAVVTCQAKMASPVGNATDEVDVSLGNHPTMDITSASLTTAPGVLVATISGPQLAPSPPPDAPGGMDFYLLWSYQGTEWFVDAHVDVAGNVSYASGNTNGGAYNLSAHSYATGSFTGGTLRITVPLSVVGNPPPGSLLLYPMAIDQLDLGASTPILTLQVLSLTTDTASAPNYLAASRGQAVRVGEACPKVTAVSAPAPVAPAPAGPAPVAPGAVTPGAVAAGGSALALTGAPLVLLGFAALGLGAAGAVLRRRVTGR
ncbi:MAG: S8/S53 family peptidase, partial [Mycobacteriales bacterium]